MDKGEGDKEHAEPLLRQRQRGSAGVGTWALRRAWATTAAAWRLAPSSSFTTSKGAPLAAAWCRGSSPSCVRGACMAQFIDLMWREDCEKKGETPHTKKGEKRRRHVGGTNVRSLAVGRFSTL